MNSLCRASLFLCYAMLLGSNHAFVAFDCSTSMPTAAEVSLIDTKPCIRHQRNITKHETKIQLLQPKIVEEIEYYQCLIEIRHLIYRCGKTFETFHQAAIRTEILNIDKEECKVLLNTGRLKYENIPITVNRYNNLNYITVTTYGSIESGTCYPGSYDKALIIDGNLYDRAVRISEFKILTKKGKGSVDVEEGTFLTETGVKCKYRDLTCFSANEGFIYWKPYFENPSCFKGKEYIVIFEGIATKITEYNKQHSEVISYLIHYNEYDFQVRLTGKFSRICGQKSYLTEHPNLAIIERPDIGFSLEYDPDKITKNVNLMTYVNSKLLYLAEHTKDQIDDLYDKINYDRCLAETKIIRNMLTTASMHPVEFAFQYFGKAGYTAVTRGDIIVMIQCKAISVNYTSINDGNCYEAIPILYNEKIYFVSPILRIISKVGKQVDCSSVLNLKFKLNGLWFIMTSNGLVPSTNPQIMSITDTGEWEYKRIDNLAEAGIYSKKELDKVAKVIMMPIQTAPLSTNLQRSLSGEGKLAEGDSVMNLLTEGDLTNLIEETANSAWKKIYGGFQVFGNFFSTIIGIILTVRVIKFIINMFINSLLLYREIGWDWRLCFFWWENMVHHILRKENTKELSLNETDEKIHDPVPEEVQVILKER